MAQTRKSNHPYAIKALGRLISNMLAFLALSTVHDLARICDDGGHLATGKRENKG